MSLCSWSVRFNPNWASYFYDATFDRSAAAFNNPDHVSIAIHRAASGTSCRSKPHWPLPKPWSTSTAFDRR